MNNKNKIQIKFIGKLNLINLKIDTDKLITKITFEKINHTCFLIPTLLPDIVLNTPNVALFHNYTEQKKTYRIYCMLILDEIDESLHVRLFFIHIKQNFHYFQQELHVYIKTVPYSI